MTPATPESRPGPESRLDQARSLATAADHQLAAELAGQSAALLLALRESGIDDPDSLRAQGDRRSHELLVAELAARRPTDAVLSEEGAAPSGEGSAPSGEGAPPRHGNPAGRSGARRVWIVDPLDGTREFGEPDRPDWAVHVALVIDGFPVAGAVALPALGEIWSTARAPAPPVLPTAAARPRLAVSRTRPGWSAGLVERALSAELVPMGSAGFKALAVVRGTADIYAHSSGQYEWDSAAPVAVALAHGMHASRLDGTPLAYDNPDPYLPDLLIAHPDWAQSALRAVAGGDPSAVSSPAQGT